MILCWYFSITFSSSVHVDWTERKNCGDKTGPVTKPDTWSMFIILKKTFSTTSRHSFQLLLIDDACPPVTQHASLSLSKQTYFSLFLSVWQSDASPPIWQANTAFVMATQISRPLQRRRLIEREDWGMKGVTSTVTAGWLTKHAGVRLGKSVCCETFTFRYEAGAYQEWLRVCVLGPLHLHCLQWWHLWKITNDYFFFFATHSAVMWCFICRHQAEKSQ